MTCSIVRRMGFVGVIATMAWGATISGCGALIGLDDYEAVDTLGALGEPCTLMSQCESGYCVDGVCCESACDQPCHACTATLKGSDNDGMCEPVASGTDPHADCTYDIPESCLRTGEYDGNGACELHPMGTACGPLGGCTGGIQDLSSECNGIGLCIIGGFVQCATGVCDSAGEACATDPNVGFTLNGTGYGPHADATIYVTAVADGTAEVLQIGNAVVPQNGDFTVTGALAGGIRYTVGYFADINGNQACDAAPTDHVWIIDDPQLENPVSADLTIDVWHNTNFGACQ